MPLDLHWVDPSDERVAPTRMRCYAHAGREIERMRTALQDDPRPGSGDILLAEREGQPIGTATAIPLTMWVRGAAVPCQGVAWVGTVKTHRRRTTNEDGVATQLMRETLARARERGQVVSALMPFRASFYEHFGYGLVERRNEWTVPLSILPHGDFEGIDFYREDDLPELMRFRQRVVERGQCDIERPEAAWRYWLRMRAESGFVAVDRAGPTGPVRGYLAFEHQLVGTKDLLRVTQMSYADADADALRRQLHFLASLRDQYLSAALMLPADVPLNRMLLEPQLPHRLVNHAHAEVRQETRMQVRVLDHKRFIEAMRLPTEARGKVVVAVRESEGHESRFAIDIADGRAGVTTSNATAQFTCTAPAWASIACGDLPASKATRFGLASGDDRSARTLDALAEGPAPFSHEYF